MLFLTVHCIFQVRIALQEKIHNSILALAVCHNVTPVSEQQEEVALFSDAADEETVLFDKTTSQSSQLLRYQASSPDEVSITCSYCQTVILKELTGSRIKDYI